MFSNAYTGTSAVGPGEFDPSLPLHEQNYASVNGMIMAQPGGSQKSELPTQESQYALPPISQDFARPLLSETRRPATSAGVVQRLISTGSYNTNSPNGLSSHNDFDQSPDLHQTQSEQTTYTNNMNGMIMSQSSMARPEARTQNSTYAVALPPISQDFARPSSTETRRPATSAGIMQRSMAPGTFGAMSAMHAANLDAQRRASIGLRTISEHPQHQLQQAQSQSQSHPQHHHQSHQQPQQQMAHHQDNRQQLPQSSHSSSGYNVPSAQPNYAHLTLEQQQQRRQGEISNYNGTFAHTLDGIDPNLTGMLNYMDITRRFSVPTLTNAPFKYTTTPASATTGVSGMNSARGINNVRFNPIKAESAHTVSNQYDNAQQQRPGSSGGPIFPSDYRVGIPGSFDPTTGAPNGFFGGGGEMTPQQQQQLYTLQSAASGVFPSTSYSSNGSMIDHRNSSYSSVSLDSTRHDSLTDNSRNPSLPDIYFNNHHLHRRTSVDLRNPSLPDIYLHQQLQRGPGTGHSTTLAEAAAHQMAIDDRGDDPLSGPAHKKRPRRKFDQIERLYLCGFEGCNKSYGTLNHLNAHVSMQKHGQKRRPEEFKEIRAAWRRRKKEEAKMAAEHVAAVHGGGVNIEDAEKAAYEAQGKWLAH
ncbi:hypothetical protein QFC21_001237 [Naganishia friedmannii]|uniref:Uncharacterized protein n=1 Tax=Naganishia friedmannii TaxID=89922 RepID=A0ACC2W659_9TREE|nr:hypothetical protein QFC21_001237 [Naganishia friedmannii]